jgi:arylsulfatase A-like enzyme
MSLKKKNVIWIFGDQHRAQMLRCNGDSNAITPNIDNLAATGVNFKNAVSGFPLCGPFRGSLLTSQYPHKCVPGHEFRLPPEMPTIAHVFNENGYDTAYFGKWHLDGYHEANGPAAFHIVPPERRGGFKKWTGYENNNAQYNCYVHGGEGNGAFQYKVDGYETDVLTDMVIDYIGHAAGNPNNAPFFAVLSVQPPHDPYIAPPEFTRNYNPNHLSLRRNVPEIPSFTDAIRYQLCNAYAMVENLDMNVGRIVTALNKNGLIEDTYVLFFSDHGDMHGSHGQYNKTTPYEESVRIPFIIGGLHRDNWHTVNTRQLLNHVDIAPTTLGLCGITPPEWMKGADFSPLYFRAPLAGNIPDSAYIQSVVEPGHAHTVNRPWRGVITDDGWKYVCFEGIPWMMYNLHADPYEQMNLAHNNLCKKERKRLNERLRQWVSDTGDKFILPEFI